MSVEAYKFLHICGILLLFSGLVGLWGTYASGAAPRKGLRIALSATHGLGMLALLVSGFGMAAYLGFGDHLPVWLYLKMSIWLLLGGSMVMAKRRADWGFALIALWIALGLAAAYLALFKPV